MKEWLKRSFALLLCMIMCLSLLPEVHVHAEDADINGDGRENTMDLIRLMKYISGEDVEIH